MANKRLIELAKRQMNSELPRERIVKPHKIGLENVLVFSEKENIFVLDRDFSVKKVASRDDLVNTLCSHNGILYDGGGYAKIFETLSGKEVASRNNWVNSLMLPQRNTLRRRKLCKNI